MESGTTLALAGLIAAALAAPAASQTAVDDDTIKLGGTTYRLWGIDAPEMKQLCGDWSAGVAAAYALADLMRGKAIKCEDKGRDRYGRSIGLCRAD
jgi:endonuclease YncB( thermonuclease family)